MITEITDAEQRLLGKALQEPAWQVQEKVILGLIDKYKNTISEGRSQWDHASGSIERESKINALLEVISTIQDLSK